MNEGKLYNMKLFLIFSLILLSLGLTYALTVTLETPIGGTWDTDGVVTFNFTCTGAADVYLADLNETWTFNNNGTYNTNVTGITAINNSVTNITTDYTGVIQNGSWNWMVTCYNDTIINIVANETIPRIIGHSFTYFNYSTLSGENYSGFSIHNSTDAIPIDEADYELTNEGIYIVTDGWDGQLINVSYIYNQTESVSSTPWEIKVDTGVPVVAMVNPINETYGGTTYWDTKTINITASCIDTNPNQMYLDINNVLNETRLYTNNTQENWFWEAPGDGTYVANIRCDDDAGNIGSNETNSTFIVDSTYLTITLNDPIDGSYDLDGSLLINFTIVETNIDTCELWADFTSEGNNINFSNVGIINETLTIENLSTGATSSSNFSLLNISIGTTATTPTGYYFAIRCNDTGGLVTTTDNYTIKVDENDPDSVGLVYPVNLSTSSDYSPIFKWVSIPNNTFFEKYTIYIDNDSDFSTPLTQDVGNNATNSTEFTSDLNADTLYYWKINVTAVSGRGSESNITQVYTTDSICHTLKVGYNYCGIVRDADTVWDDSYGAEGISLYQIQLETDADYIYYNNASHDWITYQGGTTTDKYYNVTVGNPVVIYTDTQTIWPVAGYAGRVWSIDQSVDDTTWDINFTNISDGYNLFSIREQTGRTFDNISWTLDMQGWNTTYITNGNGSILYMTYVNNSAIGETCNGATGCGQFVPFRWNWTINNDTNIRYGETIWGYLNGTTEEGQSAYWNLSCVGEFCTYGLE